MVNGFKLGRIGLLLFQTSKVDLSKSHSTTNSHQYFHSHWIYSPLLLYDTQDCQSSLFTFGSDKDRRLVLVRGPGDFSGALN